MFDNLPEDPPGAWDADALYRQNLPPEDDMDDEINWEPPTGVGQNALADGLTEQSDQTEAEDTPISEGEMLALQMQARLQAISSVPRTEGMSTDDLLAGARKITDFLLGNEQATTD